MDSVQKNYKAESFLLFLLLNSKRTFSFLYKL